MHEIATSPTIGFYRCAHKGVAKVIWVKSVNVLPRRKRGIYTTFFHANNTLIRKWLSGCPIPLDSSWIIIMPTPTIV